MEQIAGIAVQGIRAYENFKCEVICICIIPKGITYKEGIKNTFSLEKPVARR